LDVDAILDCYADDVEVHEIDQASPPSSPRIVRGKQALADALRRYAERGLTIEVRGELVSGGRAAVSTTCTYPDGKQVFGIALLDLQGGKVARQLTVQAWDA
jgi:hypothetical protein